MAKATTSKKAANKKVDVCATFTAIKQQIESAEADVLKFADGNSSAGSRVRKACQEVKKLAQQLRLEIQAIKNA